MPEKTNLDGIVGNAVNRALDNCLPELQQQLVRTLLAELPAHVAALSSASEARGAYATENGAADLLRHVAAVQTGTTQREILRTLLDGVENYCGRCVLFVVKAGASMGWQGRGFDNNDEIKDFEIDVRSGLAADALHSKKPCSGNTDALDARFVTHFGAPQDDQARLLPLLLKDKVAALVYADSGSGDATSKMDGAALELLVTATGAWLEVISLRRQASKETTQEERSEATTSPSHSAPSHSAPPHSAIQAPAPSFSDPFAAHASAHTTAAPSPASKVAVAETTRAATAEVPSSSGSAAAVAPAMDAFAGLSAEDAETHRKAQRFARLLIDEIKLYNQAKVAEGRKNRDLYDHLKEDIEKSRSTYQKRYSQSTAGSADYFNHELVHILAEGDASLMGANFPAKP